MDLILPKDGHARPAHGRIKALERRMHGPVTLDAWPHPLTAEGRETCRVALRGGETLASLAAQEARRLGLGDATIAAAVNGRAILRDAWPATALKGGDIVTLRVAMRGGGGDSDPLRTVLQIALIVASVAAPYLAPASWGTLTAAGTVSAKGALLSAGVMIGGGLIVNAIAPPRLPDPPGAPGGSQGSALYSVTGGANRARPYEPLLLVLGAHRVFPDLAAREYTEVVDEDHYLHQIFHFGLGNLEVSDLRIGDSPLDGFEEVTSQWTDARGRLTLFPGNVDTEQGAALEDTDWIERTSAPGSVRIGIDLAGRLFQVNESTGDILRHAVHIEIEYWPGNDAGAKASHAVTLEHGSTTPYRRTLAYDLPSPGVYTVRLRRAGPKSPDGDNHTDDIAFSALRSYQPDPADYAGQTRLALKIRASGQLTGRLDRLSATARQKVPTWDGTRWTAPQASSNPAWIFRWYARGIHIGGRLAAGAGLSDTRIDDDALKAWGAWCAAQGSPAIT